MSFSPNPSTPPIYDIKPKQAKDTGHREVKIPKQALPLVEPLRWKEIPPLTPKPYRIMSDIVSISVCAHQNAAIDRSGALWTWGYDVWAFIDGPVIYKTPTQLMDGVKEVSMPHTYANKFCLIQTEDNSLYVMGNHNPGTMVTYQVHCRHKAQPIKVLERVSRIKAGPFVSCVILEDKRLFASGVNNAGQCGLGKISGWITKPKFVMEDVMDVGIGHFHGMGLQANGDLWIWGGDYGIAMEAPSEEQEALNNLLGGKYREFFP